MDPFIILLAFLAGLAFRKLGYPPLLGYLMAGFAAHGLGLGNGDPRVFAPIADLGVTLLLFTIGLKLNPKELAAPQVWGVAGLHTLVAMLLGAGAILVAGHFWPSLAAMDAKAAWTLAFALSFSSTVFAVKIFDERGEGASLHATIAIGILVIQDVLAVFYLVLTSDNLPSLAALGLLALPLLRLVLRPLLQVVGHGELLMLFGITAAIGASELFEAVHLKGGLGALVFGMLLANTGKANELYKSLIGLKDLFLIGFFLQIGFYGLPSLPMIGMGLALGLLIFLRPLIYYFLLVALRLRARTALLTGVSLFSYSEFGLIVVAIAVSKGILAEEWLTTLALALSLSFFMAVPFNTRIHGLYSRYFARLLKFERAARLPEEKLADLGEADIVILGMGRVGSGAYQYLYELFGDRIIGVEENYEKAMQLSGSGLRCVHGDATDHDFWELAGLLKRKLILVSLTNHSENMSVVNLARKLNYPHELAVASRYPDEQKELEEMGCIAFNLYAEAGYGFAEHAMERCNLLSSPQGI